MRRKDREVNGKDAIEAIILKCKTCHVGMADGGMPYVVPLSFGYKFLDGGTLELYFHSATEGKKLDIIKKNNKVCFEMACEGELIRADVPCGFGYFYSSVIGFGEAVFITDVAEKCEALNIIFKRQTGEDAVINSGMLNGVCVFKIVSSDFTGKMKPHVTAAIKKLE
jgi:nitroimidazol reductase NimA-like FMN-containing flavoprotein (pyridoxamine 5'-phosphate oxidase superfamily)